MPTLIHYLTVSSLLFCLGLAGVLVRRNLIILFICLEMMLAASTLSIVAFSRFHLNEVTGLPDYRGQVLTFFILAIAAAEVAIGLSLIIALHRTQYKPNVDSLTNLKEEDLY